MDARRELIHINRHLDSYHRDIGVMVLWAQLDRAATVVDDVYNEPGNRAYLRPVRVQTLWMNLEEGVKVFGDERMDTTSRFRCAVSVTAARGCGIIDPANGTGHINDILKYLDRFWSIDDYEILERLANDDVIVGLVGVQANYQEDYPFDSPLPL